VAKILLITNIFSPEIGGPAQFIEQFAAYLNEKGHTVTVICNTIASKQYDNKISYRVVRPYKKNNKVTNFIKLRFFLLFEIVRHKKIFVAGLQNDVYKYASFLKKSYVIKIVSDPVWETARNTGKTLLDALDFQTNYEALKSFRTEKELWGRSMNYARTIITPGNYVRGLITSWVDKPEKIVVIKNSADLRVFDNHLPLQKNKDEFLKIIFIGRLSNLKGVETLLLAVKDIQKIRVSICGNGPEYVQLYELSRQLQNKHVEFLGALCKKQILEILKEHHVLVQLPKVFRIR
jgi:glycosyltransferase involved in cell wall biosynthesis